jgi:hypothetical protein
MTALVVIGVPVLFYGERLTWTQTSKFIIITTLPFQNEQNGQMDECYELHVQIPQIQVSKA